MDTEERIAQMQRSRRRAFLAGVAVVTVMTVIFWFVGIVFVNE